MKLINKQLIFCCYVLIPVNNSYADNSFTELQHNPFNKPDILQLNRDFTKQLNSPDSFVDSISLPDLQAVLLSDTLPMVMIDDVILSPGKEINGYKLLSVKSNGAVFEKNKRTYHIKLKQIQIQSDQKELE